MIDNDMLRCALIAALSASAAYYAYRMTRPSLLVGRVNSGLHALMNAAMCVMVAGAQFPLLPQVALFAMATWWFAIQAVIHRESRVVVCRGNGERARCFYHGLMMAATAYMVITMRLQPALDAHGRQSGVTMTSQPHHAMGGHAPQSALQLPLEWNAYVAMVFSVVFGAALLLWLSLLVRSFRVHQETSMPTRRRAHHRAEMGVELIGAATMAIMFMPLAS